MERPIDIALRNCKEMKRRAEAACLRKKTAGLWSKEDEDALEMATFGMQQCIELVELIAKETKR